MYLESKIELIFLLILCSLLQYFNPMCGRLEGLLHIDWPVIVACYCLSMVLQPAVFLIQSNMHLEIKHNRIAAGRNFILKVNICDINTFWVLSYSLGKTHENRMLG
jgi:hypothetical protein